MGMLRHASYFPMLLIEMYFLFWYFSLVVVKLCVFCPHHFPSAPGVEDGTAGMFLSPLEFIFTKTEDPSYGLISLFAIEP